MHKGRAHAPGLFRGLPHAGVQAECPSCGHVEWSLLEGGGHAREGMVTLACKHCGFIRLHLPGWHHRD